MPMSILEVRAGDIWPPEAHRERLDAYSRYRLLFKGRHEDVFPRIQRWLNKTPDSTLVYIVANYPKLVSLVCADLLFGEEPGFTSPDPATQKALGRIVEANGLHTLNYEMALGSSMRGDCVYKMRYGRRYDYSEVSEAIIQSVNPMFFFPEFASDDVRSLKGAVIAWVVEADDRTYLRREIHTPGQIRNELWLMKGETLDRQVPLGTLPECAGLEDAQDTGYPGLLVEYAPNWRLDDDWQGISDYVDLESIVDELNNRLSRVSTVLDKHESPKLILPPGLMKYDPATKRYYISKESLDAIEVPVDTGANLPRYLVWDAQLDAAFKQIDNMVKLAFMVTETSPDAFGLAEGGAAESGRALKFRLLRTLAKVNRKRLYFDAALKNVLKAALWLEGVSPSEVHIEWRDGLPDDQAEEVELTSSAVNAGIMSRRTAVRTLQHLDGDALENELAEIGVDQDMAGPPPIRALAGMGNPTGPAGPPAGE